MEDLKTFKERLKEVHAALNDLEEAALHNPDLLDELLSDPSEFELPHHHHQHNHQHNHQNDHQHDHHHHHHHWDNPAPNSGNNQPNNIAKNGNPEVNQRVVVKLLVEQIQKKVQSLHHRLQPLSTPAPAPPRPGLILQPNSREQEEDPLIFSPKRGLAESSPSSLKSLKNLSPHEAIFRAFEHREDLAFKSELHHQLEALFRENETVLETHTQQWAHLLTDPSAKATEGFQDLVFDPCSRSAHFSLLMDLALDQGRPPAVTAVPVAAQPLDALSQLRQSKIEDFRKVIEIALMGRIAFESTNLPLTLAHVGVELAKARHKERRSWFFSKRGSTSTKFAREDVLFDFYAQHGGISQGIITLTSTIFHFQSRISGSVFECEIRDILTMETSSTHLKSFMTLELSDGQKHLFSTSNYLNPDPVFYVVKRLWWFMKGGNWHKLPADSVNNLASLVEATLPGCPLLTCSKTYSQREDVSLLEGRYGRFMDQISRSKHSSEMGDTVVIPNSLFKQIIYSNVSIPFVIEITPEKKQRDKGSYRSVFASVAPSSAITDMILLPHWMMEYLQITQESIVRIRTVHLPSKAEVVLRPLVSEHNEAMFAKLREASQLSVDEAYHLLTSHTQIMVPLKDQPFALPFQVDIKDEVGAMVSPQVNFTLGDIIKVVGPHQLMLPGQGPKMLRVNGGGHTFLVTPLPSAESVFVLLIETQHEVEVCLSTVNSKPRNGFCEWSTFVGKDVKIEIHHQDGFLINHALYIAFHSFFDTIEVKVSLSSKEQQQNDSRPLPVTLSQKRTLFLEMEKKFLADLTSISWKLRSIPETSRMDELVKELCDLNEELPLGVYLPLCFSSNRYHAVVRIPYTEAAYFSTYEKVPILLYLEVIDADTTCREPYESHLFTGESFMTSARKLQRVRDVFHPPPNLVERAKSLPAAPPMRRKRSSSTGSSGTTHAIAQAIQDAPPVITRSQSISGRRGGRGSLKYDPRGAEELQNVVFGESWREKCARVKNTSPFGDTPGWRLVSVIVKANDDLRQEQFAMQLIKTFKAIWEESNLPLQLRTYNILAVSANSGIMETIVDAVSISTLKKRLGVGLTLRDFYEHSVGWGSRDLMHIQNNFVESVAATSLVCYFLQVKDRHNANILIDRQGRVVHVDYGWILDNTMPINLEFAPFKLTEEMTQVMGGANSPLFMRYRSLCVQGFLEARAKYQRIALLLEVMENAGLQCIQPTTVSSIRQRFQLHLPQRECARYIEGLIDASLNSWSTNVYDTFQRYYAKIY